MWKRRLGKKLQSPDSTMNILIARTDNIGDLVLTLPIAGILKAHFKHANIIFLARSYTKDLVLSCTDIDDFIDWDKLKNLPKKSAVALIKAKRCDVFISVFPQPAVTALMSQAKIPYRIGTTRRWFHWLHCNILLNFSRIKSNLHEAQLNAQLLAPFSIKTDYSTTQLSQYSHLQPQLSAKICALVDPSRFTLIIHPNSNGHGREWPLEHYIELIQQLAQDQYQVLITGTAKEQQRLQPLLAACPQAQSLIGRITLKELIALIACSDGLVASTTGPIHLAGALNIFALALHSPKKSMGPVRWRPLGQYADFLISQPHCSQPCSEHHCPCIRRITVKKVLAKIENHYQNHFSTKKNKVLTE